MSQTTAVFAVGSAVAVASQLVGLDLPSSIGLGAAAVGVGFGVQSFLTVDVSKGTSTKKRKVNKKQKEREEREARKAQEASQPQVEVSEAKLTAAQKKNAKKKAKKAADKEAKKAEDKKNAKQQKKAKQAEQAKKDDEQAKADSKSKKKKDKARKKQKAYMEAMEQEGGWEQVPTKSKGSSSRSAQAAAGDDAEAAAPGHSINVVVEPKFYGQIIGPSGSTLNKLMEGTGTVIDVPKKGLARSYITISGEPAGCEAAKQAIAQLTSKGYSDITHAGTVDEGIEVPSRALGAVIGPGGANIKAIQAKTGTRINVPDRGSESNRVSIVGDADGVRAAQTAIKQLIDEGFSALTHENYIKSVMDIPGDMVRALIGTRGETIRELQKSTGTRIKVPSGDADSYVSVFIVGEAGGVADARARIAELLKPPEPIPTPPEWQQQNTVPVDPWDED